MNYYQPRELTRDGKGIGKYHFTCKNDNQVWPVGYCADGCEGHDTEDAAREHYRQYLVDGITIDGPRDFGWPKEKCSVDGCEHEANHIAMTRDPGRFYKILLCTLHATKDEAAKQIHAGDFFGSY